METGRVLDNLRMPKLQLDHRYKRLAVLQNVFTIILLWASQDIEKLFEEHVDKEKKSRPKITLGT